MIHNTRVSAIAAIGENRELGKDNQLLWNIPGELKRFKEITTGHPIIMGRKTWESLPRKPLPNRTNIIITRDRSYSVEGAVIVSSIEKALDEAVKVEEARISNPEIFIIGGGQIFTEALPFTDRLFLTLVHKAFDADTFFPDFSAFTKEISREDMTGPEFSYTFLTLDK